MICHEDNPYGKFLGVCNQFKAALDECFKEEKKRKQQENHLKSKEVTEKFHQHLFLEEKNKNGPTKVLPISMESFETYLKLEEEKNKK